MPLTTVPGESLVHEAKGRRLTVWLTDRRLVVEQAACGRSALTSQPLEKLDHVLYAYVSNLLWLVGGVLLCAVGLMASAQQEDNRGGLALAVAGVVCLLVYVLTRRKRVVFATQASLISLEARGFNVDMVAALLDAVETARQARVNELAAPRVEPLPPPHVELVE